MTTENAATTEPVHTIENDGPHKRYEVTLRVDAHEWGHAMRYLEEFVDHVKAHGDKCDLVSGGRGWIRVEHRPQQTRENYDRELAAWFARRAQLKDYERAGEKAVGMIDDLLQKMMVPAEQHKKAEEIKRLFARAAEGRV